MKVIHKQKTISMNRHGNYRTTDQNFSVVRVGDELTNQLGNYGFNVNKNSAKYIKQF